MKRTLIASTQLKSCVAFLYESAHPVLGRVFDVKWHDGAVRFSSKDAALEFFRKLANAADVAEDIAWGW